jgi:hypothetical protein
MVDEKKYDLKKIAKAHGLTEDELMLKMQDDGDVTFAKWREGPLKIAPTPKPKTVEYKPTPKPTVKPTTAKPAPAQVVQPTPLVPEIKKPFYGGYFEDPNENYTYKPAQVVQPTPLVPEIKKPFYGGYFEDPNENYTYKPAPVAFNGRMFEDPNENVTKSKPWKAESKSEPLVNTTKIIQQAKTAWNRKVLPYFTDEQDTDKQSKTQFKAKTQDTVANAPKVYDYILGTPIQDYHDDKQVYQHRSKYIDLTNPKIKTAYHNRGDKKGDNQPFKQVLFSNFDNNVFDDIHYLKRTNKLNPSEFYIGTSSEGKLIMGTGAEIANVNGAVSKFSIIKNVKGFKKDPKTGYKIKKSPDSAGHDTPFFDTDSGDVVTNILTSRSKSRFDEYGDVSGGSFIMMTPDKKVKVLASGSANELSNAIEKFKKDNKVEKLDIIKVDNGSYARTWNTNRNIVDQKFWDTYEGQNTRGGNAIYEYKNGGYVDSVLNANKNLEWVKRLYDKNPQSIMLPGQSNPSTHFMESSDNLVYPTIIQNGDGKLEYLGKGARDYAIKNKTFIEFPTENDAIQFGKNYKSGTGVLKGFQDGGVIQDNRGQWAHPGEITKINSNQITMQGVPYPVLGISDTGDKRMMYPGKDYQFKGNSVTEYPQIAQKGFNGKTVAESTGLNKIYPLDKITPNSKLLKNIQLTSEGFMQEWQSSPMYKKMLKESLKGETEQSLENYRPLNWTITNWGHAPILNPNNINTSSDNNIQGYYTSGPDSIYIKTNILNDKRGFSTGVHEDSHSSDSGGYRIPEKDKQKIDKYKNITPPKYFGKLPWYKQILYDKNVYNKSVKDYYDYQKYVADPTETRARLNNIRYLGLSEGIYDPFTQPIGRTSFEAIKNIRLGSESSPIDELKTIYTDEEIIDMLNSISMNENKSEEVTKAQLGTMVKIKRNTQVPTSKAESEFYRTFSNAKGLGRGFMTYDHSPQSGWLHTTPKGETFYSSDEYDKNNKPIPWTNQDSPMEWTDSYDDAEGLPDNNGGYHMKYQDKTGRNYYDVSRDFPSVTPDKWNTARFAFAPFFLKGGDNGGWMYNTADGGNNPMILPDGDFKKKRMLMEDIYKYNLSNPDLSRREAWKDSRKFVNKEVMPLVNSDFYKHYKQGIDLGRVDSITNSGVYEKLPEKEAYKTLVDFNKKFRKMNPKEAKAAAKVNDMKFGGKVEPQITMQGVPYPVLGISDEGDRKLMQPNKNYKFKGKSVTEYPQIAQKGFNGMFEDPNENVTKSKPWKAESKSEPLVNNQNPFTFFDQESLRQYFQNQSFKEQQAIQANSKVVPAKKQGAVSKALEVAANPVAAVRSMNEKGYVPDNFSMNESSPATVIDAGLAYFNPAFYANAAIRTGKNLSDPKKLLTNAAKAPFEIGQLMTDGYAAPGYEGSALSTLGVMADAAATGYAGSQLYGAGLKYGPQAYKINPLAEKNPLYSNTPHEGELIMHPDDKSLKAYIYKARNNGNPNSAFYVNKELRKINEWDPGWEYYSMSARDIQKLRFPESVVGKPHWFDGWPAAKYSNKPKGDLFHKIEDIKSGLEKALNENSITSQAWKLNPMAFKENPKMLYRGIGESGAKDALSYGAFRPKQGVFDMTNLNQKFFDKTYWGPKLSTAESYGKGIIAEVPQDAANFTNRYSRGKDWSKLTTEEIPVDKGKIYKKDWLQRYKEIPESKAIEDIKGMNEFNFDRFQLGHNIAIGQGGAHNDGVWLLKRPWNNYVMKVDEAEKFSNTIDNPGYTNFDFVKPSKDLNPAGVSKIYNQFNLGDGKRALIQNRLTGKPMTALNVDDIMNIPEKSWADMLKSLNSVRKNDLSFDFHGNNFYYDPVNKKFKLFDLGPNPEMDRTSFNVVNNFSSTESNEMFKLKAAELLKTKLSNLAGRHMNNKLTITPEEIDNYSNYLINDFSEMIKRQKFQKGGAVTKVVNGKKYYLIDTEDFK